MTVEGELVLGSTALRAEGGRDEGAQLSAVVEMRGAAGHDVLDPAGPRAGRVAPGTVAELQDERVIGGQAHSLLRPIRVVSPVGWWLRPAHNVTASQQIRATIVPVPACPGSAS